MQYQSAAMAPSLLGDDLISITTIPCPECKHSITLTVSRSDFLAADGGELIQKAFPNMHKSDRERLLTGFCNDCWDKLFDDGTYNDLDEE